MDRIERKIIDFYLSLRRRTITELSSKDEVLQLISRLRPVEALNPLVRIGPVDDGGYLVPDDLDGVGSCFSPGVGEEWGFERDCLSRGMKVFMADASVDETQVFPHECDFRKNFIGAYSSGNYLSMDDWMREERDSFGGDLLLQMDIEGAEYESLLGISVPNLERFRIMVVEFHRLDFWWHSPYFKLVAAVFGKLLQSHICVHSHPNPYGGMVSRFGVDMPKHVEMTFLRRDRGISDHYVQTLPHPLDSAVGRERNLNMPAIWYQSYG